MQITNTIDEADKKVVISNALSKKMSQMKDDILDTLHNHSVIDERNFATTQEVTSSMEE